jgi:hypothetical protein
MCNLVYAPVAQHLVLVLGSSQQEIIALTCPSRKLVCALGAQHLIEVPGTSQQSIISLGLLIVQVILCSSCSASRLGAGLLAAEYHDLLFLQVGLCSWVSASCRGAGYLQLCIICFDLRIVQVSLCPGYSASRRGAGYLAAEYNVP